MFNSASKWLINGLAAIVVVVLVVVASVFFAREWFLWQGVKSFRTSLLELKRLSGESCDEKFQLGGGFDSTSYRQLRFTDSRNYQLEIVCSGFSDLPIVSQAKILQAFISKKPGNSGIISDPKIPSDQYVTLVVFGGLTPKIPKELRPLLSWISKEKVVGLEKGQVVDKEPDEANPVRNLGPVTSCEGYGFTCCDALTQAGTGSSVDNLASCPSGCFEQCLSKPVVLSLQTDPLMEWEQREVQIPKAGPVKFNYIAEDTTGVGPWVATISFGDGQTATADGLTGSISHNYECSTSNCRYAVNLTIVNSAGVVSSTSPISQLEVVVQ